MESMHGVTAAHDEDVTEGVVEHMYKHEFPPGATGGLGGALGGLGIKSSAISVASSLTAGGVGMAVTVKVWPVACLRKLPADVVSAMLVERVVSTLGADWMFS
jgi:hypothetical protein